MKATIIILQLIIFGSYVFYIYKRYGVLDSISASSYKLQKEQWWKPSLFTLFTWLLGASMVAMFAYLVDSGVREWRAVFFLLSGVSSFFLGAAPWFKRKTEGIIHNVGAIGLIIFALVGLFTVYGKLQWVIIYAVIYFGLKYLWPNTVGVMSLRKPVLETKVVLGEVPNHTWWIECAAFVLVWIGEILG